ncbi:MAG: glycosyltransferase [Candidatus Eremiobacteraeota bacterium]|nr:glycosyltransferase [Candidatus Eremiobacteraeota bacterium]
MKIVFLTPDTIVDRRIVLEARSLVARGHEAVILADLGAGRPEDPSYPGIAIKNVLAGVASGLPALKDPLKKALGSFPFLRKTLRKTYYTLFHAAQLLKRPEELRVHPYDASYCEKALIEEAHLYVACDLPMLPPAWRAAVQRGVPLVYDAHEFYTGQTILSPLEALAAGKAEKALITKARKVITVNESLASLFAERYRIEKPSVIYNCTDPPGGFDAATRYDLLREKLSLSPGAKILLFQGGFLPGRNLENLVKSAALFHGDIHLVLLGFGDYGASLKSLAERHGQGRVHFLEAVSQHELLSHSASASLGIIPYEPIDLNTRFCTPNKLFEFLQAGLPVLAERRLEELKKFIDREGTGFLADLSTAGAIASAVNDLLCRDGALTSARESCLRAAPRYTWDHEGRRFTALIEEALTSPPS